MDMITTEEVPRVCFRGILYILKIYLHVFCHFIPSMNQNLLLLLHTSRSTFGNTLLYIYMSICYAFSPTQVVHVRLRNLHHFTFQYSTTRLEKVVHDP